MLRQTLLRPQQSSWPQVDVADLMPSVRAQTPDDIKIIAQFLADRADPPRDWQELTREAFALRRDLKQRGGYKLARGEGARAADQVL